MGNDVTNWWVHGWTIISRARDIAENASWEVNPPSAQPERVQF